MIKVFKKEDREELEKLLYEKDKTIENLREENEKLKKTIDELQKRNEELKKEINELTNKNEELSLLIIKPLLEGVGEKIFDILKFYWYKPFKFYINSFLNRKLESIVISHLDGDGICSSAIFKIYSEKLNKKISFFYIPQNLKYLIRKIRAKEIYVFDLVLDEDIAKYILEISNKGVKVVWIDHHKESKEISKEILEKLIKRGIVLIDENSTSCAELVKKYFEVDSEIANKLIEVASECDKEERESRDARVICSLSHFYVFADELREELAKHGKVESNELREKYSSINFLKIYELEKLKKNRIYENKDFIVLFSNEVVITLPPILKELFNKEKKDVYVIIKRKTTRIIGMTKYGENIFNYLKERFNGIRYKGNKVSLEMNEIDIKEFIRTLNEAYTRLSENHRNSLQY
jgi:oligoribonuclease NrnB/cAMP/cGMP phosphodiesterase (DHH superfamily)